MSRELKNDNLPSIKLARSLVAGNDALAAKNRQWFADRKITAINLMGTPGAGKTRLLESTLPVCNEKQIACAVLEGDQDTLNDAKRIEACGGRAVQINTGTGCHLDAAMVHAGLDTLAPEPGSLVFIENVGNLVCPALFDLGETRRVAMMAVTDGEDKPLKYPDLFSSCDLVVINKTDLLPYLDFDLARTRDYIARINPRAKIITLSASSGDGLAKWMGWLESVHG